MKAAIMLACLLFVGLFVSAEMSSVCAQETQTAGAAGERPVPLTEAATTFDAAGQAALAARLRTTTLAGTFDAPARNSRLVIENRSSLFYTYASGYATFYDAEGVRCGEGLWTLSALAPGERAEVDTPGLRLTATPATWRITALNLITRTNDATAATTTAPDSNAPSAQTASGSSTNATTSLPPLTIEINGATLPIQANNPLEVEIGRERVRILLRVAP